MSNDMGIIFSSIQTFLVAFVDFGCVRKRQNQLIVYSLYNVYVPI